MGVNFNDSRFQDVNNQKNQALNEVNDTYNNMINSTDKLYQDQIKASNDYAEQQKQFQQQQTDFAIDKINQSKEWAKQDYTREQKGAYTDYQKQSDVYGANAEAMASRGLTGTGYADNNQVALYTAYQNRVAVARDSFNRTVVEFENAIKDAKLKNSSALADIAFKSLQTRLELSLQGFQYKNQLLQQQLQMKNETEDRYYNRWQNVLQQINSENALAEQQRQFNSQMAFEREKYNYQKVQDGIARAEAEADANGGNNNTTSSSKKPKVRGAVGAVVEEADAIISLNKAIEETSKMKLMPKKMVAREMIANAYNQDKISDSAVRQLSKKYGLE